MGDEPSGFETEPVQAGAVERQYVSGAEVQRRVQEHMDAHPDLQRVEPRIIMPMPKPTAYHGPTGCNWTMHYRGQFPEQEPLLDDIVELVQNEVNIAGPGAGTG